MNEDQDRQFRFGAITDRNFQQFGLLMPELEARLNHEVDLAEYTDRIKRIYFIPVILPEPNDIYEEKIGVDPEKKEIFLQVNLDSENLETLEENDFFELVGTVFLRELSKLEILPEGLISALAKVLAHGRNSDSAPGPSSDLHPK